MFFGRDPDPLTIRNIIGLTIRTVVLRFFNWIQQQKMSSRPADDFDVVKELGKGAFGTVTKVVRRSDRRPFAMKTVLIGKMEEREVADALNECRILASVRHPRIVNFEVSGNQALSRRWNFGWFCHFAICLFATLNPPPWKEAPPQGMDDQCRGCEKKVEICSVKLHCVAHANLSFQVLFRDGRQFFEP